MPSFQVGDKFICYSEEYAHVCEITYKDIKNVTMKWVQGCGSQDGWSIGEIERRISQGIFFRYSPVLIELYE
jgi:hypothetical protein